jgi:hypothetical protein
MVDDPLYAFISAAAIALDLPLEPAWRPAVRANLAVSLEMARLVEGFGLPDELEPLPVASA